jgi:hypothetical protein
MFQASALLLSALLATQAASQDSGGAKPLTKTSHAEAIACGQSTNYPACTGHPAALCQDVRGFELDIATPFSRLAGVARNAIGRFEQIPSIVNDIALVNKPGVSIEVNAIREIGKMRSVGRVEVRRAGVVYKPTRVDIERNTYQNAFGVTDSAVEGNFFFSFEAFRPGSDVQLIVVPEYVGDAEVCTLNNALLSALR